MSTCSQQVTIPTACDPTARDLAPPDPASRDLAQQYLASHMFFRS